MGVMPNAMRTECARYEGDEPGVEGELRLDVALRGSELEEDGIGSPGISDGSGGWE
jgi:hypothetical protein